MDLCIRKADELVELVQNVSLRGDALQRTIEAIQKVAGILEERRCNEEHETLKVLKLLHETCCVCAKELEDNNEEDIVELISCGHRACKNCFSGFVLQSQRTTSSLKCPLETCDCVISAADIRRSLTQDEHDAYVDAVLEACNGNIIACPQCSLLIEVDIVDENIPDAYRIRCRCGCTLCSKCKVSPYHTGLTCYTHSIMKPCWYCKTPIPSDNTKTGTIVKCQAGPCAERQLGICENSLGCGHPCCGFKGESECSTNCFECGGREGESCLLCLEPFTYMACVTLDCGHVYHLDCVLNTLERGSSGKAISFSFAKCSMCRSWISHPEKFLEQMQQIHALHEKVKQVIQTERRRIGSEEYANLPDSSFSCYRCSKCSNPFFGGLRNCEQALEIDDENHDPGDFICPNCTSILLQIEGCQEHGSVNTLYKCNFCCTPATFFCWGTTHFCESCHSRQMRGERINHMPVSSFKKCSEHSCPLGVDHPPNGSKDRFILGCAICLALKRPP
mmetsp:Transcript_44886/g.71641  ORF Transcript_44886/g.71641 Transcript_44886/m.71641 type:complete len:505 (+) Transcript_44886:74-1588(+)